MRRRERHAPLPSDPTSGLLRAVEGLTGAIDAAADYLPPDEVVRAQQVLTKASERLSLSGVHTVVALAGATGSGKSSLFNALAGDDVARVGTLRPTTSRISAAVWGDAPAGELLDWIGAETRHQVRPPRPGAHGWAKPGTVVDSPDGLVLLDLPDVDSLKPEHRAEADRVLSLTDVFVWVTDPQKYADAVLHDRYLRAAARHQTVTLVVLNQADKMATVEAGECRDDLRRLLQEDGLTQAEVLLVSARTGEGLAELRDALTGATRAATAARVRLLGDVQREADMLLPHVGGAEPALEESVDEGMVDALARAAGIPIVLDGVAADYERQASSLVGWPYLSWVQRLRPDPLKRLRLNDADASASAGADDVAKLLGRTSLPQPTPAARAAVDLTTRQLGARASKGLPARWARAVQDAATPDQKRLADALDQAILGTALRDRAPAWWRMVWLLQVLFAAALAVGVIWLVVLAVLAFLQITPGAPMLGVLPLPSVLVAVGALGGLLVTFLARPFVSVGARRRRDRAEQRLREGVRQVAAEHLLAPVRAVLSAHRRTREALGAVVSS